MYKLDLAQREMGKVPNEFVPVKYANEHQKMQNNTFVNTMVGGVFALFLIQLYRTMHGKGPKNGPGATGAGKI